MKKQPRKRPTESKALRTPLLDEPKRKPAVRRVPTSTPTQQPTLSTATAVQSIARLHGYKLSLASARQYIGLTKIQLLDKLANVAQS